MKTIWLDTDIGSDIDDALALSYLLAREDCELIGISTVTEVENQRAKLASALCRVAGKSVPIYPGLSLPILAAPRQTTVAQATALEKWPHDTDFAPEPAVLALRSAIYARPGEITLLAIGPMTNIGVLLALDPHIPALLKEIVVMCGAFNFPDEPDKTEWNALNDPHAAALLYHAAAPRLVSFGLDVTQKVTLERAEFEPLIRASALGHCAWDMAAAWFKLSPRVTFHDPLAAAAIFEPTLCNFARGNVEVELENPKLLGQTHWTPGDDGAHEIATEVDEKRFFSEFFGVLNPKI